MQYKTHDTTSEIIQAESNGKGCATEGPSLEVPDKEPDKLGAAPPQLTNCDLPDWVVGYYIRQFLNTHGLISFGIHRELLDAYWKLQLHCPALRRSIQSGFQPFFRITDTVCAYTLGTEVLQSTLWHGELSHHDAYPVVVIPFGNQLMLDWVVQDLRGNDAAKTPWRGLAAAAASARLS